MTLRITDDLITSPDTPHQAARITGTRWAVTWLRRDQHITRNQAITAMTIASTAAATEAQRGGPVVTASGPADRRDPIYAHLNSWASELGLDGTSAVLMTRESPGWEV